MSQEEIIEFLSKPVIVGPEMAEAMNAVADEMEKMPRPSWFLYNMNPDPDAIVEEQR